MLKLNKELKRRFKEAWKLLRGKLLEQNPGITIAEVNEMLVEGFELDSHEAFEWEGSWTGRSGYGKGPAKSKEEKTEQSAPGGPVVSGDPEPVKLTRREWEVIQSVLTLTWRCGGGPGVLTLHNKLKQELNIDHVEHLCQDYANAVVESWKESQES